MFAGAAGVLVDKLVRADWQEQKKIVLIVIPVCIWYNDGGDSICKESRLDLKRVDAREDAREDGSG